MKDTISVNGVRTKVLNLRKPIALITESISYEIRLCQNHEKKIEEFSGNIEQLEKELYTPAVDIQTRQLEHPITVCSHSDCSEKKSCGNTTKVHYKSICHKPCYLDKSDDKIIGNSGLLDCRAFNNYKNLGEGRLCNPKTFVPDTELRINSEGLMFGYKTERTRSEVCFKCSHSYLAHLTINYETEIVTRKIRNEYKSDQIENSLSDIDKRQVQVSRIKAKVEELQNELKFITECSAYFARFLMDNAITPFNDALEDYINCCIANEQKSNNDSAVIKGYRDMLEAYNREKATIEQLSNESCDLSSGGIDDRIGKLFELNTYGHVIKFHMELEADSERNQKIASEVNVSLGGLAKTRLAKIVNRISEKLAF